MRRNLWRACSALPASRNSPGQRARRRALPHSPAARRSDAPTEGQEREACKLPNWFARTEAGRA